MNNKIDLSLDVTDVVVLHHILKNLRDRLKINTSSVITVRDNSFKVTSEDCEKILKTLEEKCPFLK